jgi:hypothetical protein
LALRDEALRSAAAAEAADCDAADCDAAPEAAVPVPCWAGRAAEALAFSLAEEVVRRAALAAGSEASERERERGEARCPASDGDAALDAPRCAEALPFFTPSAVPFAFFAFFTPLSVDGAAVPFRFVEAFLD